MSRKYHGIAKVNGDVNVSTLAPPAQMDLNTDLDFGLSTTPAMAAVPTWFAPVQAQLARQEQRLSQVEEIVAENQRLRADLDLAHQRIRELESRLGESQNVDLPAPTPKDFPQLGTSQSKYAPTTSPAALSPNHQVSFADAAHRGQKQNVIPAPVKTPTRRKGLTNRQRQVLVPRLLVRPTTSNRDISTDLAATNTDSDMADVNDISSALDNLSDSSFPSGDGEPGQNQ
ncbi:unnamed protein product [Rhizopus stolonifer]